MRKLADDVWQIPSFPPNSINAFVIGDVLIDAQTRHDGRKILRHLKDHKVSAHALTHAHPDHQGASHAVCDKLGLPFWVPAADADAAEDPSLMKQSAPKHPINSLIFKLFTGPGHPVDRKLVEGDVVSGFEVLDTPGHSAGHVAYWREEDGVLILGDVLNNQHPLLGFPHGLRLPLDIFTADPDRNRGSVRRLAGLEPKLVLFGHGPAHRDTGAFVEFCSSV